MNDLEYYARNMHEWPGNDTNNVIKTLRRNPNSPGVTKDQWIAERVRLQNKPSWDDVPTQYSWYGQNASGKWDCFEYEPFANEHVNCWDYESGDALGLPNVGEVLGDWRDTLEPRPEEQTMTKKEWKQGELPPIGCIVECDRYANPCTVRYASKYLVVVQSDFGEEKALYPEDVRPLRTEEEKAVEEMHRIVFDNADKISVDDVCRILYRHGYRKLYKPDASN